MRSRLRRALFRLTLMTLAFHPLAGCYEPSTDQVVVLAGDSIMQQAVSPNLNRLLGYDNAPILVVNAVGGSTLMFQSYNTGRLNTFHGIAVPDIIFLSIGTNDKMFGLDNFVRNIDAFMASVDPSTEVYWIPPHQFVPESLEYRNAIIEASFSWHNMKVMELPVERWHVSSDNIHLSMQGNELLGELLLAEIKNH